MTRSLLTALFLITLTKTAFDPAQPPLAQPSKDEAAIRGIMADQVDAWNKGNIDAFMKGYWNNDSLVFIGKSGPSYGYHQALANYKKNY